ncbi:MAG TPA: hypothetical protein P5186_03680 [Candidatus Paceibacterota bacterium]|nr:hypothetical protein [Candidatus Paceibacterota bacterium]HSA00566.1 hypothetical protein [Candidatus Paceibacterota bacterium]
MIEWNIQSRSKACQACAKAFADKAPYFTLLFQHRHHLERLDVCPQCWASQYSQGAMDRKGFISFWQGVFNVPPPPPPEPVPKENVESMLRRLCESNEPEHIGVRYVLAVMLERKRLLKIKSQVQEDGQRVFLYEHVRSGDVFSIVDPNLQLDQLEQVQHQVMALLEHGPEALAKPLAPADSTSTTENPSPGVDESPVSDPPDAAEDSTEGPSQGQAHEEMTAVESPKPVVSETADNRT